jgi:HK97 family phage major capsid protein
VAIIKAKLGPAAIGRFQEWAFEEFGKEFEPEDLGDFIEEKLLSGELTVPKFNKLLGNPDEDEPAPQRRRSGVLGAKLYGGGSDRIRVRGAKESYSTEKLVGKSKTTGMPVIDPISKRPVEEPSQLELAKTGVFLRHLAIRSGAGIRPLDEHERNLLDEMVNEDQWVGNVNGSIDSEDGWTKDAGPDRVKASLLSDNTSGGISLNPLWYDQNIITFPLLNGELFPFVDVTEMPRGSLINTASMGNPTVTWGTAEGTAITEFDATSLVSLINPSVTNVMIAVEVGRDLLSDAAVDVGSHLATNVNQRMLRELDRVIAVGNGTTEPAGINGASGLISVTSDNPTQGPPSVSDYEGLLFGVAKQYRMNMWNPVYISNEVSYRRSKAIPVGPGDERRVMSPEMNHENYITLGRPHKISPDLTNSTVIFAALKKAYRIWRRQGFESRWTIEGRALGLANTMLLIVRGRFAGRVVDPSAVSIATDQMA